MNATIRRVVLAILLFGLVARAADLLLLNHYEEAAQLIPLGLIGVAIGLLMWNGVRPGPLVMRLFQVAMALFVASGFVGVALHFEGNAEFQREVDPSINGLDLFWKVMRAKAPPALAPGAMVELGLVGLVYAFRHPVLEGSAGEKPENGE